MARYADTADVIREVGEPLLARLSDDDNGAVVDDDVLERALEDACDEVDMYLSPRYQMPLALPAPGPVRRWTLAITAYRLHARRAALESDHPRRVSYQDAIEQLQQVASGKVSLGISPQAPAQPSLPGKLSSSMRVFSRGNLRGW